MRHRSLLSLLLLGLFCSILISCGSPDTVSLPTPTNVTITTPVPMATVSTTATSLVTTTLVPTANVSVGTATPAHAEDAVTAPDAEECVGLESIASDSPEGKVIVEDLIEEQAQIIGYRLTVSSVAYIYRSSDWVALAPSFTDADGVGEIIMQLDQSGQYRKKAEASGLFLPIGSEGYRQLMLDQASDIPVSLLDCLVAIAPAAGEASPYVSP